MELLGALRGLSAADADDWPMRVLDAAAAPLQGTTLSTALRLGLQSSPIIENPAGGDALHHGAGAGGYSLAGAEAWACAASLLRELTNALAMALDEAEAISKDRAGTG